MDSAREQLPEPAAGHRPAEAGEEFFRSLAENSNDLICAFDDEGVFGYVSPAIERLLGWQPDDLVGRQVWWFVHPDDLERAVTQVAHATELDSAPGHAAYRLRHADGSWLPLDVSAGRATDGTRTWFVVFCRHAVAYESTSDMLTRLLDAEPLVDVLGEVLHSLAWQDLGSQVAISWSVEGGREHVTTGLPLALCGLDDDGPWAEARRTGERVLRNDLSELDEPLRRQAEACGRAGYWVEPVATIDGEPAVIVVWTSPGTDPRLHEFGMGKARRYVGVVLQFTAQRAVLDHAASHDPLTGLANRKALLETLEDEAGGAVLFCDLDKFKPVNDELGHGAGDELLGLVAQRLVGCVREGDLVARIGGDEFVVLCRDIDRAEADAVANRMLAALLEPFAVGQHTVAIGVSIGLALEADRVDETTLEAADQALYAAKSGGRGRIRWATPA